jgi:hypothetical protein
MLFFIASIDFDERDHPQKESTVLALQLHSLSGSMRSDFLKNMALSLLSHEGIGMGSTSLIPP